MNGGRFRAALLIGALLLVAGCSGSDSDPDTEGTPGTSETSAVVGTVGPTPSLEAPMAPEAEKSAEGAEAFVRYFWEVYDYSYLSGDVTALLSISDKACLFCKDTASQVRDLAAVGHRTSGAHIEVVVAVAPPSDPDKGLIVATVLNERPSEIVDANGTVVKRQQGYRDLQSEMALVWRGSSWMVRDLANDETTGKPWAS